MGTCQTISLFKFLNYSNGLHAGFMLSPAPIQNCDILNQGSCQPSPTLTVGLTQTLEDGFTVAPLTCNESADDLNGYPLCTDHMANATLTVSGPVSDSIMANIASDTGTQGMTIRIPPGSAFPETIPADTDVLVQLPSGFSYSYTSDNAIYDTQDLVLSAPGSMTLGIGFFTTSAYFLDFTSSTVGMKSSR